MSGAEIVLGVLLGLIANEMCDVSPWLARKLVASAAHLQYRDPARAAMRAEELEALVNERPGKLFKLATALAFVAGALIAQLRRTFLTSLTGVALWLFDRSSQVRLLVAWSTGVRHKVRITVADNDDHGLYVVHYTGSGKTSDLLSVLLKVQEAERQAARSALQRLFGAD
ncbi:hypothetical protein ACIA8R_44010 [Nonomuraea sp. NPDC051191]|uniref:hypothetical protein n=1 Tax=Nonomuraea sp. NPDC051191 TaxID=3364372 RepID=UPI0037897595